METLVEQSMKNVRCQKTRSWFNLPHGRANQCLESIVIVSVYLDTWQRCCSTYQWPKLSSVDKQWDKLRLLWPGFKVLVGQHRRWRGQVRMVQSGGRHLAKVIWPSQGHLRSMTYVSHLNHCLVQFNMVLLILVLFYVSRVDTIAALADMMWCETCHLKYGNTTGVICRLEMGKRSRSGSRWRGWTAESTGSRRVSTSNRRESGDWRWQETGEQEGMVTALESIKSWYGQMVHTKAEFHNKMLEVCDRSAQILYRDVREHHRGHLRCSWQPRSGWLQVGSKIKCLCKNVLPIKINYLDIWEQSLQGSIKIK